MLRKKYGYGGDFGDFPNTQQFCINGLLGPDRVPHPIALEAKFLQSPVMVRIMPYEDEQGTSEENDVCLVILNLHTQRNLDYINVTVALGCDVASFTLGREAARQALPTLNVPASKAKSFRLSQIIPSLSSSASAADVAALLNVTTARLAIMQELWIDVKVEVKEGYGTEWVPVGHTIVQTALTHPLMLKNLRKKIDADITAAAAASASLPRQLGTSKSKPLAELPSKPKTNELSLSHNEKDNTGNATHPNIYISISISFHAAILM